MNASARTAGNYVEPIEGIDYLTHEGVQYPIEALPEFLVGQVHSCDGECGRKGTWPRNVDRLYLCPECAERYAFQSTHDLYLSEPVMVSADDEYAYPARYLSSNLWNGFESPYFDRETVARIAADNLAMRARYGNDCVDMITYDATGDRWAMISPEGTVDYVNASEIEGHALYGIGAWFWTWSVVEVAS